MYYRIYTNYLVLWWDCTHKSSVLGVKLCLLHEKSVCVGVRGCSKYILRVVQLLNVYSAISLWCPGFKHWFYIKDRSRGTKRWSQFTKGFSLQALFRSTDVIEPDGWKQSSQERLTHSVRSDVCTDVIVMPRAGGSLLQMDKCSPVWTTQTAFGATAEYLLVWRSNLDLSCICKRLDNSAYLCWVATMPAVTGKFPLFCFQVADSPV